jgi:hypothetical protein
VIGLTKPILIEPLDVVVEEVRQPSSMPGIARPPSTSPVPLSISRLVMAADKPFLLLT